MASTPSVKYSVSFRMDRTFLKLCPIAVCSVSIGYIRFRGQFGKKCTSEFFIDDQNCTSPKTNLKNCTEFLFWPIRIEKPFSVFLFFYKILRLSCLTEYNSSNNHLRDEFTSWDKVKVSLEINTVRSDQTSLSDRKSCAFLPLSAWEEKSTG